MRPWGWLSKGLEQSKGNASDGEAVQRKIHSELPAAVQYQELKLNSAGGAYGRKNHHSTQDLESDSRPLQFLITS